MRNEGYRTWSVCVCVSVCLSVLLICNPRLQGVGLSLTFDDYAMLKTFTITLEKSPIMLRKLTIMLNENSFESHSKHN